MSLVRLLWQPRPVNAFGSIFLHPASHGCTGATELILGMIQCSLSRPWDGRHAERTVAMPGSDLGLGAQQAESPDR